MNWQQAIAKAHAYVRGPLVRVPTRFLVTVAIRQCPKPHSSIAHLKDVQKLYWKTIRKACKAVIRARGY